VICKNCGNDITPRPAWSYPHSMICPECYCDIPDTVKSFDTEGIQDQNFLRIWNHNELLEKLHEIYVKKNAAYGNSFDQSIDRYGYVAALVRMEDKMNRLEQLLLHNATPNDEAAEDTALDLANYAIMVAMKLLDKVKDTKN